MKNLTARRQEIALLMQYAVPEAERAAAKNLLDKYGDDAVALSIFHHFYSFLPEGLDDAILILRRLGRRESKFLLCATTTLGDYLYVADSEAAVLVGPLADEVPGEVLQYFGFAGPAAFRKALENLDRLPVHVPPHLDRSLCPACHAAEGEFHTLGCPVEICPWCGGQLTSCPCRFSQLGIHEMDKETQIEDLAELLDAKGRTPFNAEEQAPAYPTSPADLDLP
ncbi:MAG TPA: hypothetical protein VLL73_00335 [Desulfurivibrionaceae bacterium]|nr:hypothetical protein [Desulfurivibrionaceae bacterium]